MENFAEKGDIAAWGGLLIRGWYLPQWRPSSTRPGSARTAAVIKRTDGRWHFQSGDARGSPVAQQEQAVAVPAGAILVLFLTLVVNGQDDEWVQIWRWRNGESEVAATRL